MRFKLLVPVLVIAGSEFLVIVEQNPFLEQSTKSPEFLHLTFLSHQPDTTVDLSKVALANDEMIHIKRTVYIYCPNSYSSSKLTNQFFEKNLNCSATTRNLKTCLKLKEMLVQ
jgi:uncharacterized protein (DUF1697 family)